QFYFFGFGNTLLSKVINGFMTYGNKNLLLSNHAHLKFTFIAILFGALVGKLAYQTSLSVRPITDLLELKAIKYLGKISYGLYIYHWVILEAIGFFMVKYHLTLRVAFLIPIEILLTIFVSSLSWRYFEEPILKFKLRYKYS
ncbi:MAG: acyltransferase family protein, partial [Flammeovirgaceae bacterium]